MTDAAKQEGTTEAPEWTPGQHKMSEAQRLEAIALFRAGEATKTELAKRYGVTTKAIDKMFERRGIKSTQRGELAKAAADQAAAVAATAMTFEPALIAKRVYDTKNETYRLAELLRKLIGKTVIETQKAGKPLGTVVNDLKAIREAAAALKTCREEAYAVLGISTEPEEREDDIPELRIASLSEEEIKALQDAPLGEDDLDIPEVAIPPGGVEDLDGESDVVEGERG